MLPRSPSFIRDKGVCLPTSCPTIDPAGGTPLGKVRRRPSLLSGRGLMPCPGSATLMPHLNTQGGPNHAHPAMGTAVDSASGLDAVDSASGLEVAVNSTGGLTARFLTAASPRTHRRTAALKKSASVLFSTDGEHGPSRPTALKKAASVTFSDVDDAPAGSCGPSSPSAASRPR